MRYKTFFNKYITGVCRDCLNENSGFHLSSRDCVHSWSGRRCPQCGDYRYTVLDLRTRGRWRILFFRDKKK